MTTFFGFFPFARPKNLLAKMTIPGNCENTDTVYGLFPEPCIHRLQTRQHSNVLCYCCYLFKLSPWYIHGDKAESHLAAGFELPIIMSWRAKSYLCPYLVFLYSHYWPIQENSRIPGNYSPWCDMPAVSFRIGLEYNCRGYVVMPEFALTAFVGNNRQPMWMNTFGIALAYEFGKNRDK